jgi:hypothetical protein
MKKYRSLQSNEIESLEKRGCWAEDWSKVLVADPFDYKSLQNVRFFGEIRLGVLEGTLQVNNSLSRPCGIRNAELHDVTVGDRCLIENIGSYLSKVDLEDECYLSQVGVMELVGPTTYGQGVGINVLSEKAEAPNLYLYRGLSANEAAFYVADYMHAEDVDFSEVVPKPEDCTRCHVGKGARIVGTKVLRNVWLGEGTRVEYAALLEDVTVDSIAEYPTVIGTDCIVKFSLLAEEAEVLDGAKVDHCYIGQAAHIGLGFSATSSAFFCNCYMDNGEACSVLAGPYTVSHHKSTLLIGCQLSFCNLGSGTNMSNHAYKLGPIHSGTAGRGFKSASNAHLVWPAQIPAFTMVSGKLANTSELLKEFPFSYFFCEGDKVKVVPAANVATYGTYRDLQKWKERDGRHVAHPNDYIEKDLMLSPEVLRDAVSGRTNAKEIVDGKSKKKYQKAGIEISAEAANKGYERYFMMTELFFSEYSIRSWKTEAGFRLVHNKVKTAPEEPDFVTIVDELINGTLEADPKVKEATDSLDLFSESWIDLFGLSVPKSLCTAYSLKWYEEGDGCTVGDIKAFIEKMKSYYPHFFCGWMMAVCVYTDEETEQIQAYYPKLLNEYVKLLKKDLDKECDTSENIDLVEAAKEALDRFKKQKLAEIAAFKKRNK